MGPAPRPVRGAARAAPTRRQILTLYLALLDVWEDSWSSARADPPADPAAWAAEHVFPRVVAATKAAGPEPLAESLAGAPVDDALAVEQLLSAWLRGEELVPVEHYLARATLRGPLAALDVAAACAADPASRGDRRCPRCGGVPQLSVRSDTSDDLVSAGRRLRCARCGGDWAYSSSACASCGETRGGRRTVYAEHRDGPKVGRGDSGDATFPHLRLEACDTCRRYLIEVDLGREPRAVPEVDELVALPLDLYAVERGLTKITPNVMGF